MPRRLHKNILFITYALTRFQNRPILKVKSTHSHEGLGQFSTALMSMLSSATQAIDFLHIIDTLVAQYLKFDGSSQVRPILRTKANGHETHINLTPKLIETAIGSSKVLHTIRIDFLVPED
jgi:hypothetical protein